MIYSTKPTTGLLLARLRLELKASQGGDVSKAKASANRRYPLKGSSTCCQGRVARGLRTGIGSPPARARIASGTIRSTAQSSPRSLYQHEQWRCGDEAFGGQQSRRNLNANWRLRSPHLPYWRYRGHNRLDDRAHDSRKVIPCFHKLFQL
jgi:hypothetical protein